MSLPTPEIATPTTGDSDITSDVTIVVDSLRTAATQGRVAKPTTAPRTQGGSRTGNLLEENDGWIDGKFRLLEKLGEGGFGLVFKAEQIQPIHRLVAVKVLKAGMDTQQVIARFDTERQSLALMEHPNIARVLDAGETERGQPYFVMELVRGRSITSYATKKGLTLNQKIELFIPVCHAVNHAHQKGIIHRDLKPSNVMVMEEDGLPTPKVIDFGIAKVLEQKDVSQTLATGMDQLVGTPGYISPEQIEHGSSHVDTRSDVYALGSILMELLTGKALVTPMDVAQKPLHQILRDQVERDPPRPSSREPALKGDLDWIILKALERDPARRYGSTDDLADDLRRYLHHQPVHARPPSQGYLIGKFVRRHRVGVSATVAVAVAVLAGGITSTALYFESEKNRIEASRGREEIKKSYSSSAVQMARQFTERTDYNEAVAWLCRALDADPDNNLAATNLLSLLEHVHLLHPTTPALDLPVGAQEARLVALSREANRVLAVSTLLTRGDGPSQHVLSLWDMTTGQRNDSPLQRGVIATGLMVSRDGRQAILAQDNGSVELWSLAGGERRNLLPQMPPSTLGADAAVGTKTQPQSVLCLALSGDGHTLAAGGDDGSILVWNLRQPSMKALAIKQPPPADAALASGTKLQEKVRLPITSIALDYLGTVVVTASNVPAIIGDTAATLGLVSVWDASNGQPVGETQLVDEGVSALGIHRESEQIAVGLHSGVVHVADYRSGQEVLPALVHPSTVTCLTINADASTLTVGDGQGYLHAWNMANGQPRFPAQAHDGEIVIATEALERGLVTSVSRHGELQVWNSATGERVLHRLQHSIAEVNVTADGSMLALAPRHEPNVQVWSIHNRMATRRFLAPPEEAFKESPVLPLNAPAQVKNAAALGWNRTGTLAAAADAVGQVTVFDMRGGQQVGESFRHPPAVGAVALSRDGKTAVTSGRDQEVRFWDVQTGQGTGISLRHDSFVSALALSPDEKRLATVSDEGEIRIWDTTTGDCLTPGIREGAGITELHISDNGQRLIFKAARHGWFSLPMPPERVQLPEWFRHLAEALARRRLTDAGKVELLTLDDLKKAIAAVPKVAAGTNDLASRWAAWLLADPEKRPLSPLEDESFDSYLETLAKNAAPAAAAEAQRYRPNQE